MLTAIFVAIATAVGQSTSDATMELGIRKKLRRSHRAAALAALSSPVTPNLHDYPHRISGIQVEALQHFVESPQFAHLVLHATVAEVAGKSKERMASLREQVGQSLRLTGQFEGADLLEGTDFILAALGAALPATGVSANADQRFEHLPLAADLAAAGVRNSKLLAGLSTLHEFHSFADDMRAAVAARHGRIRVSHAGQTRIADYDDLYVTPHLRQSSQVGFLDLEDDDDLPEVGSTRATLDDLVVEKSRVIVLGDPGAGKSTFAEKLVHDVAVGRIQLGGAVPFLLVVRDHTASLRSDHELILHYLTALCWRPYQIDPPPQAVEYLLLNGRALVVVDGLDELGDARHRESFTRMLEAFAHRYPATRIVVTSRVVGYFEVPLDEQLFPFAEIAPFTDSQVGRYATSFFRLDERFRGTDPSDYVASFLRESAAAADIRRNPLMLSLLCTLYTSANFIPRNKPELYEKCAELLFETWDRSRGLTVDHRYSAYIKPAVQRLAWKLLNDSDARQAIPRAELAADLTQLLGRKHLDEDEAAQASDDFISFCAGRAWVLAEVGSDRLAPVYGFVHRTFLEYFAACQLVKNDPRPAAVWDHISGRLGDGGWEVAVQLAVQLLDRWHEDGADQILRLALDSAEAFRAARKSSAEALVLKFCVRTLESVTPDNDVLRDLAYAAVTLAGSISIDDRQHLSSALTYGRVDEIIVDSPLTSLLPGPMHADPRTAKCVVDALRSAHSEAAEAGPAGLVFAAYIMHCPDGVKAVNDQPVPPDVLRWLRLIDDPSPDDVREWGAQILFTTTRVFGRSFNPVFTLLPTRHSPRLEISDELITRLTALGPALIEKWAELQLVRDLKHRRFSFAQSIFGEPMLGAEWFMGLPVPARETAVLLAVVACDLDLAIPKMGNPLQRLWTAGEARGELERLAVPERTAQLVVDYIGDRR